MQEDIDRKYPHGFMWGASTSAHQVEGGTHNQWTVWELAHASELAKAAEERYGHLPLWSDFKKQMEDPQNYVSGRGIEHYSRFRDDFDLLKKLNLNTLRFGIEWSRLEPEEGKWDENEIEHYREYIDELKKRGVEPVLNIWHWSMPIWFTEKGAFSRRANIKYFERLVEKIAREYGKSLSYVITLNEPNVYTSFGYMTGFWPPQEKNIPKGLWVYWNLVVAHKKSYRIFKKHNPKIQVGIAAQLANIQAKRPHNIIDEVCTKSMRYFWNWWFLRRIRRQQDFIGVNYYFTDYYTGLFQKRNPKVPLNDLGWYMEPEGLYPLLLRVWARFKTPIIVTLQII
jgi:beta-glucosidase